MNNDFESYSGKRYRTIFFSPNDIVDLWFKETIYKFFRKDIDFLEAEKI